MVDSGMLVRIRITGENYEFQILINWNLRWLLTIQIHFIFFCSDEIQETVIDLIENDPDIPDSLAGLYLKLTSCVENKITYW